MEHRLLPIYSDENYRACRLCPRSCGVDRYHSPGYCGCGPRPKAARAALHHWEEPCISGINGSGAVFFSGCTLGCCFCQNHRISIEGFGRELSVSRLSQIFLELQAQGAHNINLVTATQYLPSVTQALNLARGQLKVPVVYNCSGYERQETIRALAPYVDIWLPDLKYFSKSLASAYSQAPDYFRKTAAAIRLMAELTGPPVFEDYTGQGSSCTLMKRGVLLRHMVLPSHRQDSMALMEWISQNLPKNGFLLSLLSQYTPFYKSKEHGEINRRVTTYEYETVLDQAVRLGLTDGYRQKKSSAKEEYTPSFELQGID